MADEPTKPELEKQLESAGLPTTGRKSELVERARKAGLATDHKPEVFVARFDSASPPTEKLGPVPTDDE